MGRYSREYYKENRSKIIRYQKEWKKKNAVKINETRRRLIQKKRELSSAKKIDIERNLNLYMNRKDLDMSLKKLGPIFKIKIRELEKKLKHGPKFCKNCKKELINISAKFCSSNCKVYYWRKHHKERLLKTYQYHKHKMEGDWKFALKIRLRDNLREAIRYYSKTKKFRRHKNSNRYINYEAIIKYLGPCPGKRREWHIDHIKPLNSFDFSKTEEIKAAFAPTNLQWLPAKENLKKGKRY